MNPYGSDSNLEASNTSRSDLAQHSNLSVYRGMVNLREYNRGAEVESS